MKKDLNHESPLHGDVLETILTYVPLIHLLPARHVSNSWNVAVSSSLQHFNPLKPWLILHTQSTRSPHTVSTHAYDPRSNHWLKITQQSIHPISTLRSSTSSLLYMLTTPSTFSFSYDPLHLTWHHIQTPLSWRNDPIVALLGCHLIIAGATCHSEDAVRVYDLNTRTWEACESMPPFLSSRATSSLSITTTSDTMYVVQKSSGVCFTFNPKTKSWSGPYNLSRNKKICVYSIGCTNKNLILTVVEGNKEGNIKSVNVYKLNHKSLEVNEIIGEMPLKLVEKMKGNYLYFTITGEISVNVKGSFVFIVNNSVPEEVFVCEIGGGACKWWRVRNVMLDDTCRLSKKLVYGCSDVDVGVLEKAMAGGGKSFGVEVVM